MKTSLGKPFWGAAFGLALALAAGPGAAQQSGQVNEEEVLRLAGQIRKKIVTLSNYSVFDSITFGLKHGPEGGYVVVVGGYASRPSLKKSVGRAVSRIEGVENVVNNIEVLPTSGQDEDIRFATYAKIYGHPALSRYNPNRGTPIYGLHRRLAMGISNDPPLGAHPIHIIVNNGNVTLEGVVDTESDKTIAGLQANSVSGVFSVTNNLHVLQPPKKKKKKKG